MIILCHAEFGHQYCTMKTPHSEGVRYSYRARPLLRPQERIPRAKSWSFEKVVQARRRLRPI
jgi:hypothetical protein